MTEPDDFFGGIAATTTYVMVDEGGARETFEAISDEDAVEHAEEWIAGGEGDGESTVWVSGRVREVCSECGDAGTHASDCESSDRKLLDEVVHATVDPTPPPCTDKQGHDWRSPVAIVGGLRENPGVRGHGGGVIIVEVCLHCGTERETDTWAQDRSTGQQGLTSVTYERGKYADEVEALREEDA